MKRDRRTVYQLITEETGDELTFGAFGTPESVMQEHLPDNVRLNFTPEQGAILMRIMDRAAIMDSDTYMHIYLRMKNAIENSGFTQMTLTFDKGDTIKILRAIKLTSEGLIKTGLGVRDAAWALRTTILTAGGIKEYE